MSSADKLRADLARSARRRIEPAPQEQVTPPVDDAVAPLDRPARTKKVRMTIDLEPVEFDDFRELRMLQARQRGVIRINASDVMVALLRRFMRDEQLRREVLDVIEREGRR